MKNFLVLILVFGALIFFAPLTEGADQSETSPKVITTNPKNGAADVDSSLSKITVTFSKPMLDKSWSWSYENKDSFPQTAGQPYYTDNGTTCVLPVKLEPGKRYAETQLNHISLYSAFVLEVLVLRGIYPYDTTKQK